MHPLINTLQQISKKNQPKKKITRRKIKIQNVIKVCLKNAAKQFFLIITLYDIYKWGAMIFYDINQARWLTIGPDLRDDQPLNGSFLSRCMHRTLQKLKSNQCT